MAKIPSYPHAVPTTGDSILISKSSNKTTRSTTVGDVIDLVNTGLLPGVGTVTSIGVTAPSAFTVTNSPVTSAGTIAITGSGTTSQYIDGTGSLQDFDRDSTSNTLGYKVIPSDFDFSSIPSSYANSIWEIINIHDLGGANIVLPVNVTLKFNGGKVINYGQITLDKTQIEAPLTGVFDTSGTFTEDFICENFKPQWFGAKGDGTNNDTVPIQKAINVTSNLFLPYGIYNISAALEISKSNFTMVGNGSTLHYLGSTTQSEGVDYYKTEYAIAINGSTTSAQENVNIRDFIFTGVNIWGGIFSTYSYLQKGWDGEVFGVVNEANYTTTRKNFIIEKVKFNAPYNEAIALTNTQVTISDCEVLNGLSGQAGSPNTGSIMVRATNNVVIKNVYTKGGYGKAINTSYVDSLKYNNITCVLESLLGQEETGIYVGHFNRDTTVANCTVIGTGNSGKVSYNAKRTTITNCNFTASGYFFIQGSQETIINGCIFKTEGKSALRTSYHSTWGDLNVNDIVISNCQISSSNTVGDDEDYSLKTLDLSNAYNLNIIGNSIKGNIYARPIGNGAIKNNTINFTKTGAYVATRGQGCIYLRSISKDNSDGLVIKGNNIFTDNNETICYMHGNSNAAFFTFSNNTVRCLNITQYPFTINYATTGDCIYSNNVYQMPAQTQGEQSISFSGTHTKKVVLSEVLFNKIYTLSNESTNRSLDANGTIDQVSDVLATLIKDLQSTGVLH